MASDRTFKEFNFNFLCWKIFGLWSGRGKNKNYKYYSFIYLTTTLVAYNILLTLNLIYTPRTIEYLIREVIFYFNEVVVICKVTMVLSMKRTIIKSFDILDSDAFKGYDDTSRTIIEKHFSVYKKFWKCYALMNNIAYFSQVLPPLFVCLILNSAAELPICNYYFLSDETRNKYFYFWYIYQSAGIYGHMMYNVSIDTFISGMIFMGIGHFKSLSHKLENLNLGSSSKIKSDEGVKQMKKLNQCLEHYDKLLEFCEYLQQIFTVVMFFQYGVSSVNICVVMYALTLDLKTGTLVFMILYFGAMTIEIFLPGWLGTQLTSESEEISKAVYNSDWIGTSEPYKRSLRLLMQRTNKPIILTGLNMFPLSLGTFTSIMKSAYSFFTLLRNVQDL